MNFTDLYIGQFACSEKMFTYDEVVLFSKLNNDSNPIHLNDEYASKTIYGQCIVHGMLVGSLISSVLGMQLPGPGSVFIEQHLKYIKPVFLNEMVKVKCTVKELISSKSIVVLDTICQKNVDDLVISGTAAMKLFK